MSEFDKEKERKRLEEKYERDKKKREATERMSELLLQGATMTNAHCSECGDPIFRYDGQEFCATCERPIERTKSNDTDAADAGDGIEVTTPRDDARVQFGDRGNAGSTDDDAGANAGSTDDGDRLTADSATASTDRETAGSPMASTDRETAGSTTGDDPRGRRQSDATQTRTQSEPTPTPQQPVAGEPVQSVPTGGEQADIQTARQSLTRTLVAFSQRAEATDDPRRAREHLQAAREAAETLKSLR